MIISDSPLPLMPELVNQDGKQKKDCIWMDVIVGQFGLVNIIMVDKWFVIGQKVRKIMKDKNGLQSGEEKIFKLNR